MHMRRLRGDPEGVVPRSRIVARHRAARFHRRRDQPLVDDVEIRGDLGIGQRLIDDLGVLAAGPFEHDIVRRFFVELWSSRFGGLLAVDHHR